MAGLKDRVSKEVTSPTEKAVLDITGKKSSRGKYPVNVVFDGDMEMVIKERAKEMGLGVATYIKVLVKQDLNGR